MFDKCLDDYYKNKSVKEICLKLGISQTTFNRKLREQNIPNRRSFLRLIDTGNADLNQTLKTKYMSIVNRCNGKSTDKYGHYNGMDYVKVYEWVEFCNDNKALLLNMWKIYKSSGKLKNAISVDRIDDSEGYLIGNMQFVFHGFNSWKRSVNPISVLHDGKTDYFMGFEEASRHYGLRSQSIGEAYAKTKYRLRGYDVKKIELQTVLNHRGASALKDYYEKYIR